LFDDGANLANAFANAYRLYLICRMKQRLNGKFLIDTSLTNMTDSEDYRDMCTHDL